MHFSFSFFFLLFEATEWCFFSHVTPPKNERLQFSFVKNGEARWSSLTFSFVYSSQQYKFWISLQRKKKNNSNFYVLLFFVVFFVHCKECCKLQVTLCCFTNSIKIKRVIFFFPFLFSLKLCCKAQVLILCCIFITRKAWKASHPCAPSFFARNILQGFCIPYIYYCCYFQLIWKNVRSFLHFRNWLCCRCVRLLYSSAISFYKKR